MIVFEKEQVIDNKSKRQTTSGLTSGLAGLKKALPETEKKDGNVDEEAHNNTVNNTKHTGTGGTQLTLEYRVLASKEEVFEGPTSLFCCKVFFPKDRHVVVNVTEDISIEKFVQSVFVGCVGNAEKFRSIEVSLYAADAKGEVDDDCPVLDNRRPIGAFGITNFVFRTNNSDEFEKIELNADVVNIGPSLKDSLTDPLARLLNAAEVGNLDEVRKLIDSKQVDVSATGIDNWTALHFAARQGHLPVVNYLIKQSADLDTQTSSHGWTPLHLCAYQGNVEIGEMILTCGAAANITDKKGTTPCDFARQQKHEEMIEVLEDFIEEEKMLK